ncbi:MAG TPA: DUF904 domain-containing protein [Aeromonadales bacterium]|nr:DUF904 domain-containing protein [Aeromonadales bacterium]
MSSKLLKSLEERTNELAYRFEQLKGSHVRLQSDHLLLLEEKDRLLEHNRLAREKIESMIKRLKLMEQSHD